MSVKGKAPLESGNFDQEIKTTQGTSSSFDSRLYLTEVYVEITVKPDYENISYLNRFFQITKETDLDFKLFPEYKMFTFVNNYFMLLTSIPGIITNPLTIFVSLKIIPQKTSELHMLFLGSTDLCVVMLRLLIYSLNIFKVPLTDQLCTIFLFSVNLVYVFSNWILVCWTLERLIAVFFPIKLNVWCTLEVMKIVLCFCLLLCSIALIPDIIFSYRSPVYLHTCMYYPEYYKIYSHILTTVYIYAPMAIIIVCNAVIIFRVKHSMKLKTVLNSNAKVLEKRSKEHKQIKIILVTVSGVFVLLHLTQILAKIWQIVYPDEDLLLQYSVRNFIRFYLFIILGYRIIDFQNSVNFFLYCAIGSKVRGVLKTLFSLHTRKQEH